MTLDMTLDVNCPRCGRKLPPIAINTTLTSEEDGSLRAEAHPDLNRLFYAAVRLAHPWCFGGKDDIPDEVAA